MEINSENIELIDRYLSKELSDKEREAFEKHMSADTTLRDTVENQRLAISLIRHQAALKKMQKIGAAHDQKESDHKKQPRIRRINFIFGIAAALALLIIGYIIIPRFIPNNEIVQTPSTDIDTDKYGTDSPLDFNESLTVKHLKIIDGVAQKIQDDKKINLSIIFDQTPEAYYDFRSVNNDLFILIDKKTLDSENIDPAFFQLTNKGTTQLYLKLNNQFYLIEDGVKQPLVKEVDTVILNILENH